MASTLLASGVVAFDVAIDGTNDLHLVFARARETTEFPAGIYYSKTRRSITSWSTAKPLYSSKYYRSMIPPIGISGPAVVFNQDLMHVNITTIEDNDEIQVIAGWENPAIKRLYYAQSFDDGTNWDAPIEIVSPSDELINITPQEFQTIFTSSVVMQLWQVSEPGGNCSLFYRTSEDKGQQWSVQQSLEEIFGHCPEKLSWIATDNDQIIFVAGKQNVITLIAWNGKEWSLPQSQDGLNQLINEDTLDLISFESYDTVLSGNTLFVIGKDNTSSQDIWITQKVLGDLNNWYGAGVSWSNLNIQNIESNAITDLQGFKGDKNQFHFAWTQPDSSSPEKSLLQLMTVAESGSVEITTILDNLEGTASQLATTSVLESDRMALMWRGGTFGHLYSAWVFLTQITNSVGWSKPEQAGSTQIGHSPAITKMSNSKLIAVYSIPFSNESGIYWMESENGGETWSVSHKISNITLSEDCPQVLNPQPLVDAENNIHIMYECSTFEGGIGPLSLYSIQSNDLGETWSQPALINDRPTSWSRIFRDNKNQIHRLWKTNDEKTGLWHSFSSDSGNSWSSPQNFALVEESDGATDATMDMDGNINVLQAYNLISGKSLVNYYRWTGDKWINLPSVDLSAAGEGNITAIASGIDSNSNLQLAVAFNSIQNVQISTEIILTRYPLSISESTAEISDNEIVVSSKPENTIPNPEEQTPTSTIQPVSTPSLPLNLSPSQGVPAGLSAIVGVLISLIFIVAAFIFMRRKK